MIGINEISSYLPEFYINNIKRAEEFFGEKPGFIEEKIGAHFLPRKKLEEETSDMAVKAIKNLIKKTGFSLNDIDLLVIVTQNPDGYGLPHTSAIIHRKLELASNVAAFDLSLGCSGYVYGLSVVKGLMEQANLKNGVLVTADPYSKILNNEDRNTSLLFGDAATATWLSEKGKWKLGIPVLQTDGQGSNNLCVTGNVLSMNGRQVFNFASKQVPQQIRKALEINSIDESEIDRYVIHQGSLSIVDAIARKFPSVKERYISDIKMTGNTVSSSIPLLLEKYVLISDSEKVLVSGFGVGLSWASNILYKEC
tara:strand:- start:8275 stop:9204 length:930 start_codon:yes stop_codon:yes gene_type:complete